MTSVQTARLAAKATANNVAKGIATLARNAKPQSVADKRLKKADCSVAVFAISCGVGFHYASSIACPRLAFGPF